MQTLRSNFQPLVSVKLPYRERQMYMHTFDLADPKMPEGYEDYLEPVRSLCVAAGAVRGVAHMTVDEKVVRAGMSQRRPRPHVDGCFVPAVRAWGHDSPTGPGWNHYCNNVATEAVGRMPVIVASSAAGCRAWKGEFYGDPRNDGDLSHIADQLGNGEIFPANFGYLLSADCVHESMILPVDTKRSFLRIALPVGFLD
jgi:hypothetical protein